MKHDLQRFLTAQEEMYDTALQELKAGRKEDHWMWFIFPQLRGLGSSPNSMFYGITGLDEARAYLAHPVLGQRLTDCCQALLGHQDKAAVEILGKLDAMKLQSSMTLFAYVSENGSVFHKVLDRFYLESMDSRTVGLLETENAARGIDPDMEIVIPEGVTDVQDWTCWVQDLYRQGKREQEVRVARRIIRDLLKKGHSEEFLKDFRNQFTVLPNSVSVTDAKALYLLAETDYDEEY